MVDSQKDTDARSTVSQKHMAIVYNPAKVDEGQLRAIVAEACTRQQREEPLWFETAPDDDGAQAAADALAADPSLVVVAGGDGTVRVVAERLAGTGTPLVIAAAGTGNLFARALGLPINDLGSAIQATVTGRDHPIDMGYAELRKADGSTSAHAFLVMAGIGLDARMAADTNPRLKKHIGWLAYADPIGRSVIGNEDFALHYQLDGGRRHSSRVHTVIVGNCGTLTGGVLLIPDAQPDDGVLDTVMLRPGGPFGWMQIGVRIIFARFLHRTRTGAALRRVTGRSYALRFGRARRVRLAFNAPQAVELDGDSFGDITAARIEVRPGVLQLRH